MTFSELEASNKDFLVAAEVSEFLGVDPQSLRMQAQMDPDKLGFPVIVCGTRMRIPRLGFLHFVRYGKAVYAKGGD